jgi:energy-coupling factor transporter ATP-binding protein EcfA2
LSNPTDPVVQSLIGAVKLSEQDAKTCVYWRLASRYAAELDFFPALYLVGPSGSGKTTIMHAMRDMPGEASDVLACTIFTMAALRDELVKYENKLFIADEFDETKPEVQYLLMARTTRSMASIPYKNALGNGKYEQVVAHIFGPSILHTRNGIDDPARSSRGIQIFTRHEDGPFTEFEPHYIEMALLEFDMSSVVYKGGRVISTWSPILEVARQLGDEDYITAINADLEVEARVLRQKAEFDNASLVLAKIVEYICERPADQRWQRIDIEAWIGRPLRFDFPYMSPLIINNVINQLGLLSKRTGGRRWLFPEPAALRLACKKRGYHDEEFEALADEDEPIQRLLDFKVADD